MGVSTNRRAVVASIAGIAMPLVFGMVPVEAASRQHIAEDSLTALHRLYAENEKARLLGERAKAILVFPEIVKGGFFLGGQTGNGALFVDGKPVGYYNISAASFGFQFGAQAFSYALFFMSKAALDYLEASHGWAIGSGPSVVVLDKGAAASISSTTLTHDVYAVPFGQKGLMAGVAIEGSKITHINPAT